MQLEARLGWKSDWGGSQIGAEARLVQRPDWCRGQIGAEARLAAHLSTAVAQREKKCKQFVFNKYFSLVLGVLKSKISKKSFELLLRKLDFKLFHYKARVQPVSKITTIATRNRCWM